jgi:hypothetical protein
MAETESETSAERIATFTAFATVGALNTTQNITHALLADIGDMEGTDAELVAEETLCLVATATARAAEVGLRDEPAVLPAVRSALLNLPYAYRNYLVGSAMIAEDNAALAEQGEQIRERLNRKQQFYTTHLPQNEFPGQHALTDKMALWMGRVSPPKLPESPQERLEKLSLVPSLLAHLKLILAYGRRGEVPS